MNNINKNSKAKNLLSNNELSFFAIYTFFWKYLKRQKFLAFLVFLVLPIFFTCDILLIQKNASSFLPISMGTVFILLGFCSPFYIISGFLLELKNSVIYKRIGLTGIKPLGFLLITSIYCLSATLLIDVIGLFTSFIVIHFIKGTSLWFYFNFNTLLLFLLSLFSSLFLTVLMQFLAILINSSSVQWIVMSILAVVFFAGSFLFNSLAPDIFVTGQSFFNSKELVSIIYVLIGFTMGIILFSFLTTKFFRWA